MHLSSRSGSIAPSYPPFPRQHLIEVNGGVGFLLSRIHQPGQLGPPRSRHPAPGPCAGRFLRLCPLPAGSLHMGAVRRSCQTMALPRGRPVELSHSKAGFSLHGQANRRNVRRLEARFRDGRTHAPIDFGPDFTGIMLLPSLAWDSTGLAHGRPARRCWPPRSKIMARLPVVPRSRAMNVVSSHLKVGSYLTAGSASQNGLLSAMTRRCPSLTVFKRIG